jgi:hypothetical protein
MRLTTIPVLPYLTNNRIATLRGLAPDNLITISGRAPSRLASQDPSFNSTSITRTAVASLGFESIASVEVDASTSYFLVEYMVRNEPVERNDDSIIKREHYGAGMRIVVKGWNLSAKAKSSLPMLIAECTIASASSSYEISFIGLELAQLGAVVPFVGNTVGDFDGSANERLGALAATINSQINAIRPEIRPTLLAVDVDTDDPRLPYVRATSTSYALQSIWNKERSLDDALANISRAGDKTIDARVVREVYLSILGASGKPNDKQKDLAMRALFWAE